MIGGLRRGAEPKDREDPAPSPASRRTSGSAISNRDPVGAEAAPRSGSAPTRRAAAPRPPEGSSRRDDVVLAPLNHLVPASTPRVTAHPELLDHCGETGRVGPSGLLPHLRRMRTQARTPGGELSGLLTGRSGGARPLLVRRSDRAAHQVEAALSRRLASARSTSIRNKHRC